MWEAPCWTVGACQASFGLVLDMMAKDLVIAIEIQNRDRTKGAEVGNKLQYAMLTVTVIRCSSGQGSLTTRRAWIQGSTLGQYDMGVMFSYL